MADAGPCALRRGHRAGEHRTGDLCRSPLCGLISYPVLMGRIALPNLMAQAATPLVGSLLAGRRGHRRDPQRADRHRGGQCGAVDWPVRHGAGSNKAFQDLGYTPNRTEQTGRFRPEAEASVALSVPALVACSVEVVGAFFLAEERNGFSYGGPQVRYGAGGGFAEQRLEFGEGLFDRVEVWAVGREVPQRRARRFDGAFARRSSCEPADCP